MKKFIVCLILICTICIGCFALTACDDNDNSNESKEPAVKCELIKNEYKTVVDSSSSDIEDAFIFVEYNFYTFRLWYSYDYYINNLFLPKIKCESPFIIEIIEGGLGITFKYIEELTLQPSSSNFYAEYITDNLSIPFCIKPNSWIYFSVPMIINEEINKSQLITIEVLDDNLNETHLNYILDLSNTYKTA